MTAEEGEARHAVTETPSPEALRHGALDALGPHADERARAALQAAHLRVEPGVAAWESSAGPVSGHRVTLAVDATTLGLLRSVPALEDALHASLANAVAAYPGQVLSSLWLRWASEGARPAPDGYRDRPPDPPETLQQALASYLRARSEAALASLVEGGSLDAEEGATVTLGVTPSQLRTFRSYGASAPEALDSAVRDLLGHEGARVLVE